MPIFRRGPNFCTLNKPLNSPSYLVVNGVLVVVVREDDLLPLEHQILRADLEPRRLRPALPVAHVHHAVVELLLQGGKQRKKERKKEAGR